MTKLEILCTKKVPVNETFLKFLEFYSNSVTKAFFENFDLNGKSGKEQHGFKRWCLQKSAVGQPQRSLIHLTDL